MRKVFLALGVAAIALASPGLAQGQGRGHGQGQGKDNASAERGRGGGDERAHGAGHRGGGNEGNARAERGRGKDGNVRAGRGSGERARPAHAGRDARPAQRRAEAHESRGRGPASADRAAGPSRRAENRGERRMADRGRGRAERRAVVVTDRREIARLRPAPRFALVRGCPPGLARRHNGCLPPGQARRLMAERPWYGRWWRYPDEGSYRYDGGYLYRLRTDGLVAGFIPLAGGALWPGHRWPADYAYEPLPDYYADYYGYDDPYDYRYADGIVYGLDPGTETIRQLAGLVTGDDWAIGSRMPRGYDVYNVPHDWRDEYHDTPDDWYRYSDGHVYRVDPTTQLIEAAIRLLA